MSSETTFTLDLGEHYIKIADVEAKKSVLNPRSIAFNDLSYNPYITAAEDISQKTSEMFAKLVHESGIKKHDVNVIIPDSQSYTRIFEMPLLTDKELISAIKYQADQFIPIPIEKVNLDIHILNKNRKTSKATILLVAASNAVIDNVIKIVENASFIPESIENETSAVLRLLGQIYEIDKNLKATPTALYVNFGNTSTSLYLYDSVSNLPLQVHNFSIGRDIFFKDIKANYSLSEQQITELIEHIGFNPDNTNYNLGQLLASPLNEFVSEIKRFMLSSKESSQTDIKHIYIFGEGSKFAFFDKKISDLLTMEVSMFDISKYLQKNNVSEFFKLDWPLLIPAVGGCLR